MGHCEHKNPETWVHILEHEEHEEILRRRRIAGSNARHEEAKRSLFILPYRHETILGFFMSFVSFVFQDLP
jgi:hypothetical protein